MQNPKKPMMHHNFQAHKLVSDLGGVREIASSLGVPRTAPYRWMANRAISSRVLARLKDAYPDLDLNQYFQPDEGADHERENGARSGT